MIKLQSDPKPAKKIILKGNQQRDGEAIIGILDYSGGLTTYSYNIQQHQITELTATTMFEDFEMVLLKYDLIILATNKTRGFVCWAYQLTTMTMLMGFDNTELN